MAKGAALGAATLVGAPIMGAKEEGAKGFVKGLGVGIVGAVTLPVTGVGVGAYQLGGGIANSAEAVKKSGRGMMWDEENREWFFYSIDKEVEKLLVRSADDEPEEEMHAPERSNREVVDDAYYNILQVQANCTSQELLHAYNKQASGCHPERCHNEESIKRFNDIAWAYQFLSNPSCRSL